MITSSEVGVSTVSWSTLSAFCERISVPDSPDTACHVDSEMSRAAWFPPAHYLTTRGRLPDIVLGSLPFLEITPNFSRAVLTKSKFICEDYHSSYYIWAEWMLQKASKTSYTTMWCVHKNDAINNNNKKIQTTEFHFSVKITGLVNLWFGWKSVFIVDKIIQ